MIELLTSLVVPARPVTNYFPVTPAGPASKPATMLFAVEAHKATSSAAVAFLDVRRPRVVAKTGTAAELRTPDTSTSPSQSSSDPDRLCYWVDRRRHECRRRKHCTNVWYRHQTTIGITELPAWLLTS